MHESRFYVFHSEDIILKQLIVISPFGF